MSGRVIDDRGLQVRQVGSGVDIWASKGFVRLGRQHATQRTFVRLEEDGEFFLRGKVGDDVQFNIRVMAEGGYGKATLAKKGEHHILVLTRAGSLSEVLSGLVGDGVKVLLHGDCSRSRRWPDLELGYHYTSWTSDGGLFGRDYYIEADLEYDGEFRFKTVRPGRGVLRVWAGSNNDWRVLSEMQVMVEPGRETGVGTIEIGDPLSPSR